MSFRGRPREYKSRTSFTTAFESEILDNFRTIANREGVPANKLFTDFMKQYIKDHGDGNPQYSIIQWVENAEMKATPAFSRDRKTWKEYIEKLDETEAKFTMNHASTIKTLAQNKLNYGTTNVL